MSPCCLSAYFPYICLFCSFLLIFYLLTCTLICYWIYLPMFHVASFVSIFPFISFVIYWIELESMYVCPFSMYISDYCASGCTFLSVCLYVQLCVVCWVLSTWQSSYLPIFRKSALCVSFYISICLSHTFCLNDILCICLFLYIYTCLPISINVSIYMPKYIISVTYYFSICLFILLALPLS